jgi:glucose-6-phosphate 1-dehydrogenase
MAMVLSISETHPAPPCSIVILGASGDLAKRKLLPALYNLEQCGIGLLPPETSILGFARTQMSTEAFRTTSHEAVKKYSRLKVDEECWRKFEGKLDYLSGLDQPDAFKRLRQRLEESEKARGLPPNRVFYFSIPPEAIRESIERLDEAGLIRDPHDKYFSRVVVEKPIGHDLPSAIEISNTMRQHLDESQIFRIDHYLGKETVQNLLVLRFANTIFERLWGSRNVSHVQITVAETEGVGTRAGYYDHSGAMRDMVQNHMLQVLTMLAMEPPVSLDAAAIRESKLNLLRAMRPISIDDASKLTVRARYTGGSVNGQPIPGYMEAKGVAPNSRTETYVAIKTYVDNWRWSGVPFFLRHGKCLPKRETVIAVQFHHAPKILFNRGANLPPNVLMIRIQPDEGFSFDVMAKRPGLGLAISPVRMNLHYETEFGKDVSPDAYERLLLDVMAGDGTLFPNDTFVHKSWEFIQNILDAWKDDARVPMREYAAGSWGPDEADQLIRADGFEWLDP